MDIKGILIVDNQSISSSSSLTMTDDFYWPLMENNPMKILSIAFSVISSVIGAVLAMGMIWFERFGSSKKRTVINQLVSASCWTYIFHTCFVVQLLEAFRWCHISVLDWLILKILFFILRTHFSVCLRG